MNILSCFDGMSCGQIALNRLGIKYDNYYASEIDKYAIKVTQANYPNTIQLGSIENWRDWDLSDIDLIMAGSPCQGFSVAGKRLNFDDPRSKLFFTFEKVLKHYQPKWWLLENVVMLQEWQDIVSQRMGRRPIRINSALVSAQNRERLYWTNIENELDMFGMPYCDIPQPKNRHIYLKDIVIDNCSEIYHRSISDIHRWETDNYIQLDPKDKKGGSNQSRVYFESSKFGSLSKSTGSGFLCCSQLRLPLTIEIERLQTIPDNHTNHVSDTQRKIMIGNGWTIEVITHILQYIKKDN